jgi:hypothetical protein
MDDTSLRRLMRQPIDDEPGLGPQVITGAIAAARRIRRRRRVASASAAAVAPALVVLLATGVLAPAHGPSGATGPPPSPGTSGPVRHLVPGLVDGHFSLLAQDALYSFLPATGAQGALGAQFDHQVAVLEIARTNSCMARYSYSGKAGALARNFELYVNPPLGSPYVPGWVPSDIASVPNLYDLTLLAHGLLSEVMTGSPNGPSVPPAVYNAIDNRFTHCQNLAAQPFTRMDSEGMSVYPWVQRVKAIQASPPAVAANRGYGACVQRHGAPATAAQSPDAFWYWLNNLVSPTIGGSRQQIAARTALDRRWTHVFVTCAAGVLAVEGRLQLAAQKVYLDQHYDQVLAVERLAIQTISRVDRN